MSAPDPDVVIRMAGVGVRRGRSHLLRSVDWTVELDERWVVLGPNGAGKTTLLQLAAAQLHPSSGVGRGARRAARRGRRVRAAPADRAVTSAALAGRVPNNETVLDVVVSAGYAVVGRWREQLRRARHRPGPAPALPARRAAAGRPPVRHAVRGRAQAGADRPRADDRPGAAAARRAGGRARPGRPGAAGRPAGHAGRRPGRADHGAGHPPRRGDPARVHARPAAAQRPGRGGRADRRRADPATCSA